MIEKLNNPFRSNNRPFFLMFFEKNAYMTGSKIQYHFDF